MIKEEKTQILQARIDKKNKDLVVKAAKLRSMPTSDYVRSIVIEQARKEVDCAEKEVLQLTADEQLSFWKALDHDSSLIEKEIELGQLMRGEI